MRLRRALASVVLTATFASGAHASGRVLLSEVYARGSEFIELHNDGDAPVDLAGWHVVGDVQHVFEPGAALAPGSYLVLAHSSEEMAREFGPIVVPEELWGRLHGGCSVRLHDASGRLVDAVRYPKLPEGLSYQRRPTLSTYEGPLAWMAAAPTPGGPNAVPPLEAGLALDAHVRSAPVAGRPTVVSTRVHGDAASVRIAFRARDGSGEVPMVGAPADGASVYTGTIPALAGVVRYRVVATASDGRVAALDEDPLTGETLRFVAPTPDGGPLPVLRLEAGPGALEAVLAGRRRPVTVVDGARVIEGATLERTDGASRRRGEKPTLRLRLPRGTDLAGRTDLHLGTSWRDGTQLRESLALSVYRACGVPVPTSRVVRLEVNGDFFGVFTEREAIGPTFLASVGLHGAETFDPEHVEGGPGRERFEELVGALDTATDERLAALIDEQLDVERYLGFLVATAIVSHWDSIERNEVWCLARGRWLAIPSGLDRTWGLGPRGRHLVAFEPALLGTLERPVHARGRLASDRIRDRVLSVPALRARFYERLAAHAGAELAPERFAALERHVETLEPDLLADRARWPVVATPFTREHLRRDAAKLALYARDRRAYLARTREPVRTQGERRAGARGELLALASLWGGIAVGAVARRRRSS